MGYGLQMVYRQVPEKVFIIIIIIIFNDLTVTTMNDEFFAIFIVLFIVWSHFPFVKLYALICKWWCVIVLKF